MCSTGNTGEGSEDYSYTGEGFEDYTYTDQGTQDYGYTTDTCLAPGATCLSFTSGSTGTCCSGAAGCNVFKGDGYMCSTGNTGEGSEDYSFTGQGSEDYSYTDQGTQDYSYTTDTCLAPGATCLSFTSGSTGTCCSGAAGCNV